MLPVLVVFLTVLAQKPLDVAQGRPITPPPQAPIPESKSRLKSTQHEIVVRGCVQNGRLMLAASGQRGRDVDERPGPDHCRQTRRDALQTDQRAAADQAARRVTEAYERRLRPTLIRA